MYVCMKNYYCNIMQSTVSDVSCMSMRSSELSDLEKILGNTNWTFYLVKIVIGHFISIVEIQSE